jgi:hypothetical protein
MKKAYGKEKSQAANERLRLSYRPRKVRMLFVGESPPASGKFFYAGNSGLYRAVRHVFLDAIPALDDKDFLETFRVLGCYLVDLCGKPVDRLDSRERKLACMAGEVGLSRTIKRLQPKIIVTLARSIAANVRRAEKLAGWQGQILELPYPGRWKSHREVFAKGLTPILKKIARPRW